MIMNNADFTSCLLIVIKVTITVDMTAVLALSYH